MRGSTRKSIGDTPSVRERVDLLVTFIVPSSAANAAPVRPAMTMPSIIAAISRAMAMPTRSAT